jgi:hypothetical protein
MAIDALLAGAVILTQAARAYAGHANTIMSIASSRKSLIVAVANDTDALKPPRTLETILPIM